MGATRARTRCRRVSLALRQLLRQRRRPALVVPARAEARLVHRLLRAAVCAHGRALQTPCCATCSWATRTARASSFRARATRAARSCASWPPTSSRSGTRGRAARCPSTSATTCSSRETCTMAASKVPTLAPLSCPALCAHTPARRRQSGRLAAQHRARHRRGRRPGHRCVGPGPGVALRLAR